MNKASREFDKDLKDTHDGVNEAERAVELKDRLKDWDVGTSKPKGRKKVKGVGIEMMIQRTRKRRRRRGGKRIASRKIPRKTVRRIEMIRMNECFRCACGIRYTDIYT